jgi:hypothetical protein
VSTVVLVMAALSSLRKARRSGAPAAVRFHQK